MKQYIALKAVQFDKSYALGEVIPENVIAPNMRKKLLRCGLLAVVETEGEPKKEEEPLTNQERLQQIITERATFKKKLLQKTKEEISEYV